MNKLFSMIIFYLSLCIDLYAADKVLIITHVYNRPDFIALHKKTFDAFLKEEYEYIVFNDSPTEDMSNQIKTMCKSLGIQCLRVPDHKSHRQSPSARHADGIKYSLERFGFDHDGVVLMIDSDMFLIRPFSVLEYMKEYDFIAGYQSRPNSSVTVYYAFPGLVFMNMKNLPNKHTINFDGGDVAGSNCDVGGHTYYYFKNNPQAKVHLYTIASTFHEPKDRNALYALGYDDNSIDLIFSLEKDYSMEFHGDHNFLHHYAGGSNWPGYTHNYLEKKKYLLNNYIDQQIMTYKKNN